MWLPVPANGIMVSAVIGMARNLHLRVSMGQRDGPA
jgi:hypothetical protein